MRSYLKIIFIAALTAIMPAWSFVSAQVEKEVRVVKPYTPTLSDAEKINLLPEFNDSTRVTPEFNYSITPKRYGTHFTVRPIQAARMVGLPLQRLYKSQLSLGIGNYFTPFAELTVNKLRSRKSSLGLYLKHQSSAGKVKLENDMRVQSNYSDNIAEIYGKHMYYRSVVEGGLSGGYNSLLYYGYRPELDTILEKKDIRQKIYSAGARFAWYSSYPDSSHFNYHLGFNYQLTHDAFNNTENAFNLKTKFEDFIGDWYAGIEAGFEYYAKSAGIDSFNNLLINVNPYVSKAGDEWRFLIGLNTTTDIGENSILHIYPRANFQFNIVKNVLIPYMGVEGHREINNYRKILFENPFIVPGLSVMNSDYSPVGYFGLKGRYSSKMSFDFRLSYMKVNDMYFFVPDTTEILHNQYTVEYDNASILTTSGEITWNQNEKLQLFLKANYYNYSLDSLAYPWHRPSFEANLGASYNLRDKILVDAGIFYTGKRYAPGPDGAVELNPYLDANLSLEYRYTKLLSFFLRLNNFTASRYQIWYQYPAQRFQAMVGFTYAL
jgi:hypothetical protein